jgi:hypothetical protein
MIRTERQIKERIIKDLMYKPIIRDIKRCLLCNRMRIDSEFKKLLWESNFIINFNNHTIAFAICPECRIKDINAIYKRIIEREIGGMR